MKFVYATGSQPLAGYTIKRGVGIGGFGEVYFATSDAGKEVALKRIQRNLEVEVRGVTQCINLKHPNLVALYDIKYDEAGEGWIVMEYVAGESLKEVLDRNPAGLPDAAVRRWFTSICSGVAYLHDHGIVHRDLKPANIFDDQGTIKIGDYGLSKFISCSRRSGQTESVGTFHYMAPEIGKGEYGKEIDVYALGIMLYELLTGRVPFEGESSQEIIMKHLTADPDLSAVGFPYKEIIRRALLKDPRRRFPSVAEMVARLDGETVSSPSAYSVAAAPASETVIPATAAPRETIFITEENADEIVFGPLRERADAQPQRQPDITYVNQPAAREPIAAAVQGGVNTLFDWWQAAPIIAPVKVLILVICAIFVLLNVGWVFPLAMMLGAAYLIYYGLRGLVLAIGGPSRTRPVPESQTPLVNHAARQPRAESPPRISRKQRAELQRVWTVSARQVMHKKTLSQRLGELNGSLLKSAVACGVTCLLVVLVTGQFDGSSIDTLAQFTWLGIASIATAWTVLAAGKLWEGDSDESVVRRFVLLIAGLVLGAGVFGAAQFLTIDLKPDSFTGQPVLKDAYPENLFDQGGEPNLVAYMVFFAALLGLLKWWRRSDPIRKQRVGLFPVLAAALVSLVLPLPQPWGLLIAATASIAVQIASPFMKTGERDAIQQKVQHQIV